MVDGMKLNGVVLPKEELNALYRYSVSFYTRRCQPITDEYG
jgi:hypothetical protein